MGGYLIGCTLCITLLGLLCVGLDGAPSHIKYLQKEKVKGDDYVEDHRNDLLASLYTFAGGFFQNVVRESENFVYSPLKIHSAFSMLMLGAGSGTYAHGNLTVMLEYEKSYRDDLPDNWMHHEYRKILDEITSSEDSEDSSFKSYTLSMLNAEEVLREDFVTDIGEFYNHSIEEIRSNDETRLKQILIQLKDIGENYGFTHDFAEIKDLRIIEHGLNLIVMALVRKRWDNFIMFPDKGQFVTNNSAKVLYTNNVRAKQIQFAETNLLKEENCREPNVSDPHGLNKLKFRALQLPLEDDFTLSMFEPLKRDCTPHDLRRLEQELLVDRGYPEGISLEKVLDVLDRASAGIDIGHLMLPSFKIENEMNLRNELRGFNLDSLTRENSGFTFMTQSGRSFISNSLHPSIVEIQPDGMGVSSHRKTYTRHVHPESAAQTTCSVKIVNPFLFLVRHKDIPILLGHMVKSE